MSSASARRSLASQMNSAAGPLSYVKMAAAPRGRNTDAAAEESVADQDAAPPLSPGTANSSLHEAPSPTSTKSLLRSSLPWFPTTPIQDPNTGLLDCNEEGCDMSPAPRDIPSMTAAFSQMALHRMQPKLPPLFMQICSTWG